jgi:hypothetical protein
MTATNKQYSYPRVMVIQIDVHPTGKNPINTLHAFHAWFVYGPVPYISRGLSRPSFASPHKTKKCPYSRKKSWQPKTGPTVTLGHLILPPSRQPWSRGEMFQPSGYTTISAY